MPDSIRVYIEPHFDVPDRAEGGIRRVVEAQFKYLPRFDVEPVKDPRRAHMTAGHGMKQCAKQGLPFVSHCHGLLWSDYDWNRWHYEVNQAVTEAMVQAQAVTAPSNWVAQAITRGILVSPTVVYHGVDADDWSTPGFQDHGGYVYWNKARQDPVSDCSHMQQLARRMPRQQFVSTIGIETPNVNVVGVHTVEEMRPMLQKAGVYLSTARETFGIGTLEALAAGVPVAGWDYGGQSEIVIQGETGYLAPFGDWDRLVECVDRCMRERERLSDNCRADARQRWAWPDKIEKYAAIYHQVMSDWYAELPRVSVIVPCHNLGRYLKECLQSVQSQAFKDYECLIVDDDSSDNTAEVARTFCDADSRFRYLRTPKNLKLVGTLNFGAAYSRGKYLINLDADNLLGQGALGVLSVELDNHPEWHIVYGMLDVMNEFGEERRRNAFPQAATFSWEQQMAHLNQIPSSAMYRRVVWERSGGWRERMWRAEDAEWWCRVTSFGFRAAKVTDEATLIYRMRSDSKSSHEPGDGDWTAWFPWRAGATNGPQGLEIVRRHSPLAQPELVPFGAQGKRTDQLFWEVWHHQNPVVSVVIPVGPGHEKLVIDALDSLVAQDIKDWEAVVVNNTGHAFDAVPGAPYARLVNSPSSQVGAARNAGVKAARGELVYFLDADDYLSPHGLKSMLKRYTNGDAGYIYTDYIQVGEDWSEKRVDMPEYNQMDWKAQHSINILIAKADFERVGGFDASLTGWEDWELFVKLAVNGICGAHLAEPTWNYRFHTGTRRDDSLSKKEMLLPILRERYAKFYDGEAEMTRCCGGNSDALMAAKRVIESINQLGAGTGAEPAPVPVQDTGILPPTVRMAFTGEQVGAITFFGRDGRQYRGGNNNLEKYADVVREDVDKLANTGQWVVVPVVQPEPPVSAPELPVIQHLPPEPPELPKPANWLGPDAFVEPEGETTKEEAASPAPGDVVAVKKLKKQRGKKKNEQPTVAG